MQWVIVSFPDSRDVYIDGVQSGRTNDTLAAGDGTHRFDLGEPDDYDPPSVRLTVLGTTYNSPAELAFTRNA